MKRRPILFHVDTERGFRGGERQLLYLAAALRARGWMNVICCRPATPLDLEARRQGFDTRPANWRMLLDARRMGAIIHTHTGRAAGWALPCLAMRVPMVAHRRVDFPLRPLAAMLKYRRSRRVVAVSAAIGELLRDAGVPSNKISVIFDGLPCSREESSWAGAAPNDFVPPTGDQKSELRSSLAREHLIDSTALWIGNLAALVAHKDHATLIEAASQVIRERPTVRFLIAGRGPEEPRLRGMIARRRLSGHVHLLGHIANPWPLLKALDVYVQSSWGEGMGSVLLEAAACGVPVAATTAGGIPDIIAADRNGLLVPPRNPDKLAKALVRLVDDRPLRLRLAAEGLARLSNFNLKRMAAEMEEVYASLTERDSDRT